MQQTLAKPTRIISGVALHSGARVSMQIFGAPAGTGLRFFRTDIQDRDPYVAATYEALPPIDQIANQLQLRTVLRNKDAVAIETPEHLMAALIGCGIDNAEIRIDGPEVPLLDGSAAQFIEAIEEAGILPQEGTARTVLKILKPVRIERDGKYCEIRPTDKPYLSIDCAIDFPGFKQRMSFDLRSAESFKTEIAKARTFTLDSWIPSILRDGKAQGGSIDNALILKGDSGQPIQGQSFRLPMEQVRHKILDCIGDFGLAGKRLYAEIEVSRGGHAINAEALLTALMQPGVCALVPEFSGQHLPYGLRTAHAIGLIN